MVENSDKNLKKIRIKLIKSTIGANERQKRTIQALGLRRVNQTVTHIANSAILGMVKKVEKWLEIVEE